MKSNSLAKNFALGVGLVIAPFIPQSAQAANITQTSNNAGGTSGLNSGTGWPGAIAPASGNNYFTGAFLLRTPAPTTSGSDIIFAGDSLSVETGGRLLGKIGNGVANNTTTGTITISNLILNGGTLDQAGGNLGNATMFVAGAITVNASSFMGAIGAPANNSLNFEIMDITAAIGGSAGLTIAGTTNGGADSGVVKLSAANTYSGTMTIATPTNGFVSSATNRLLQLNNVNALQNATLNLTSVANGVSFASPANTGAFNIGALSGTSNQLLTDTASTAVSINVGGNNGSTSYSGILSGSGSLTKSGSGTLSLSGANTYSGGTTVSAGVLTAANASALGAGSLTINGGTVDSNVSDVAGMGTITFSSGGLSINTTSTGFLTLSTNSNFSMSGGIWTVSIGSISSYDQILGSGTGTFSITGGTISLSGISDYTASYTLLSGFGFGSVSGLTIGNYDTGNWTASLNSSGVLTFTAVPEPSTLFVAAALFGMVGYRMRRRLSGHR